MGINTGDLLSLGYSMPLGQLNTNSLAGRTVSVAGFGSQLTQLSQRAQFSGNSGSSPQVIHLRLERENCVYTGGMKGQRINQNVYAEYTEDSTADDPIVRISGEADSGSFDFVCHINDIDPRNASYAELSALYGHLVKTGKLSGTDETVTPCGYEFVGDRDMLKKQDFIAGLSALSVSDHVGPRGKVDAKYMLNVYQDFMQQNLQNVCAARGSLDTCQASGKLSAGELADLSSRYKPSNMTQEEYFAFLDELEEKGVLSKDDKMLVKNPEMRFGEAFGPGGIAPGEAYIEENPIAPLKSLTDCDGNVSVYVKALLERELALAERTTPLKEDRQRIEALRRVYDVLRGMEN